MLAMVLWVLTELQPLQDQAYIQKRANLLHTECQSTHELKTPTTPPNLAAALNLWCEDSLKAAEYASALAGTNSQVFPMTQHVAKASVNQLKRYLDKFGPGYLPLAEEYLFQLPFQANPTAYTAIADLFEKENPQRGIVVFKRLWRKHKKSKPALAQMALDQIGDSTVQVKLKKQAP
jgi:hypothetical protein